jgi:radical SAM superfamily enzyme YgiQ (UPF0313 family)
MVCVGEGEYPMLELANSLERGKIDYSIQNLWFKKDGQIIQNPIRPLIEDLDSLPMPDKDLYYSASPHFRKSGLYITMASRGCAYSCSYCCHSYLRDLYEGKGKYLRQRKVPSVINELSMRKDKYGIKFVVFLDNCFGHDKNWLKDFSNEYRAKIGIEFGCIMHPAHVCPDSLKYLKSANCYAIDLGIQAWNDGIRKRILNRYVDAGVMERAITLIQREKINIMTDSIFGLPEQREDDIINSAFIYTNIRPKRIYFYMLRYYPNTGITRKAKENNWLTPKRYEEIMDGINVAPFAIGGDGVGKNLIKFQILFYLIDFLPKTAGYFLIKNRIYRFFPTFLGYSVIIILRNLLAFDLNARLLRKGAFYRYSYFAAKNYLGVDIYRITKYKSN